MQKFERGELSLFPFYERFGCELSDTENGNKWYMEYCARKKIGTALYISVMFVFEPPRFRVPSFTCEA